MEKISRKKVTKEETVLYEILMKGIELETECKFSDKELKLNIEVLTHADIYDEYYLKFSDRTEFSVSRVEGSFEWDIKNPEMHNTHLKAAEEKLNEFYAYDFDKLNPLASLSELLDED